MPWQDHSDNNTNNNDGPWGSSGGSNGGGKGPWGGGSSGGPSGGSGGGPRRPSGGGGPRRPSGGGGGQPPDLEDLIRQGQDRFRSIIPGQGGPNAKTVIFGLLVLLAIWFATGFYRVNTDEQGVVLRFGKYVATTNPGLNYHLPSPIETALTPKVTRVNEVEVGFRSSGPAGRGGLLRDVSEESLMLTGDENIVDIDFKVQWVIGDAGKYLFNVEDPDATVKAVAESAMREVVGQRAITPILNEGRAEVEQATRMLMQGMLDSYEIGIVINQVQLQKADPPAQVIDAFRDVQAARADAAATINQAQAYARDVVPRARGEAQKIIESAQAYKAEVVANADGEAQRFLSVYGQYKNAKDVTRRRIFLETMEQVLGPMEKIIIDKSSGQGVIPYLPLNQLQKNEGK